MSLSALTMNIAGESSKHQAVGIAPNMCITPAAPSPLPMPYPNQCMTSNGLTDGCDKTHFKSKPTLNTDGFIKGVKGNQPGTQKDVATMTTGGVAYAMMGPPNVFFEGTMCVFTGSPGFINAR